MESCMTFVLSLKLWNEWLLNSVVHPSNTEEKAQDETERIEVGQGR